LEKQKQALGLTHFLKDYSQLDFLRDLYFNPTCTICGFDSGYKGPRSKTVNPCKAVAKVDFRLVPDQSSEEILGKVEAHLARLGFDDVEVVKHNSCEPCRTSPNTSLVKALLEAGRRVYPGEIVLEPNSPGSGPMSVVVKSLGISVASGECVAHAGSRYHAPNENIFIQDFTQGVKHMVATLALY
jgi:acetylornithine deacetylase/succinyl-diaminopimelate desuccinylase-like protein